MKLFNLEDQIIELQDSIRKVINTTPTTKEATSTEAGSRERSCSCGEKETEAIGAKGHSFGDWTTTKDASCSEEGSKERSCSCGAKETDSIGKSEHSWGDAVDGVKTCSGCGETKSAE